MRYSQQVLDQRVDLSTQCGMADSSKPRQILGVSLSPKTARAVKTEVAMRGITLRKLFEEMWEAYQNRQIEADHD